MTTPLTPPAPAGGVPPRLTGGMPRALCLIAALACVFAFSLTPSALAAPALISKTSFSAVTETSATLEASVDPTGGLTKAHLEYATLADFKAKAFEGAQPVPSVEGLTVPAKVKGTGALQSGSDLITGVATTAGAFGVGQTITATGIPAETTIKAVEPEPGEATLQLKISKSATASAPTAELEATGPQPISAEISGLTPATGYVFRAFAKKTGTKEIAEGTPATFYTFASPPSFAPCPNEEFRSGKRAPLGIPGAFLPDCRAFEQASPLDKNGNDALSSPFGLASRAAADGGAVTFGSAFGLPGGQGAQEMPYYQAARGAGGWLTTGLYPPAEFGEEAHSPIGHSPDLSTIYAEATRLGPKRKALFELHRDGSAPIQLTPYVQLAPDTFFFGFAGTSADASTVLIEAPNALPQEEGGPLIPGSVADAPNLYAWERASGELHLASVMNSPVETQAKLAKGAYAGPYAWLYGPNYLHKEGGPSGNHDLISAHAVGEDGSLVFTSRSDGHLYMRINPTEPQSAVVINEGEEECTEPAKACTLDVSGSRRTTPDPGGHQPAVFHTATADGSKVFFTSSEKLTDDANTGPEQPPAQIGRTDLTAPDPNTSKEEDFLPARALGIAFDPAGEYVYWVNPALGTIGRAKLNGEDEIEGPIDQSFIEPGEGECIQEVKGPVNGKPAVYEDLTILSSPRYVAVDDEHVYWTNTGRRDDEGPLDGGGTIGRATLEGGGVTDIRPDFICGTEPNPDRSKKVPAWSATPRESPSTTPTSTGPTRHETDRNARSLERRSGVGKPTGISSVNRRAERPTEWR
jgi:hypothetical protein